MENCEKKMDDLITGANLQQEELFKGTKNKWVSNYSNGSWLIQDLETYKDGFKSSIAEVYWFNDGKDTAEYNALLISKAPEMLDMLQKAKVELSRIKGSMMAHPDCVHGSEFDDYTSSAQECENEIELLIKEATEL